MHGSEMIEACGGYTNNHYSLYGVLIIDGFSMRRTIFSDAGVPVVRGYAINTGEFTIDNGICENGPLISRYEWIGEISWSLPLRDLIALLESSPGKQLL